MQARRSIRTVRNHALVWLVFIAYELSIVYINGIKFGEPLDYVLHYSINICLFYLNAEGFKYIYKAKLNRAMAIILLISAEIGLYVFIQQLAFRLLSFIYDYPPVTVSDLKLYYGKEIYRAIYFIGFSIAYWFAIRLANQKKVILELENRKLKQENEKIELERNLIQSQNAYLQSQLNPHLLFNTLSFIYNSVRKLSEPASQAILLLSDMMRYSLSEAGADGKVSLENEIGHIKNMITLNQLRFNDTLNINLTTTGQFKNETIIPLLLLSFIENIYKHGDLTDADNPAKIDIACENHVLKMTCSNKKSKSKPIAGWGIGLDNARARLHTQYPGRYTLNVVEDHLMYSVLLTVNL